MSYSTVADVRMATGFNNVDNIATATVTTYIDMGDAIINSYIGSVYVLPLSTSSSLVQSLSIQIATALLYINEFGEENQNTNRAWEKRLKIATNICDNIRQLKMRLYDDSGNELSRNSTRTPAFYPTNASSQPSAVNSTAPKITMDGQF